VVLEVDDQKEEDQDTTVLILRSFGLTGASAGKGFDYKQSRGAANRYGRDTGRSSAVS